MLEVRTATYGPGIDQSQHAKSVSHIINIAIFHLSFFDSIKWSSAENISLDASLVSSSRHN